MDGASLRSSITSLVMPFADSLRMARTPSMSLRSTAAAIFSSMLSTEVWYGMALTTICSPRGPSSISAIARMRIEPRPVR